MCWSVALSEMDCGVAAGACANTSAAGTSSAGLLPSLLIVGTRKGGTTALSGIVAKHQLVVPPDCRSGTLAWPAGVSRRQSTLCLWNKEVRYFTRGVARKLDLCWYRSLYHCADDASGAPVSANGRERVGFDASPDYLVMNSAKVSAMAAALGPRARLVVLLRNPADRFYSAYNMAYGERQKRNGAAEASGAARGAADGNLTYGGFAASLDRMLACAPECPNEEEVVSMFFDYGLYARHLAKFEAAFGKARLLVEKSEDFYADAWPTVARVLAHARLPPLPRAIEALERARPAKASSRNAGGVWGGAAYTGKLAAEERRKLGEFYRPHNEQLYTMLGRDFGWEAEGHGWPAAKLTAKGLSGPALRPEL